MELLIRILIGVIAFFHLYFLYFEMFAWTTKGRKIFRKYPAEFFEKTKVFICLEYKRPMTPCIYI